MKSNVCELKKDGKGMTNILDEVEKTAVYNGLSHQESLRLRLLAEELTGMLPSLIERYDGKFWIVAENLKFELHVELISDEMDSETRAKLISVSKEKRNAKANGILGQLIDIVDEMFMNTSTIPMAPTEYYANTQSPLNYSFTWSLEQYRESVKNKKEDWDELEKSIIGSLSDDVLVGIRGRKIDMIITKNFEKRS